MRLRHRYVALVTALLLAAVIGVALVAYGLLHQAATDASIVALAPTQQTHWMAAVRAAGQVIWLAAAAIAAVLMAIALTAGRSYLFGDLERLDRSLQREGVSAQGDEAQRLSEALTTLRAEVERLSAAKTSGLAAVASYSEAMNAAADQLAVADRLALTGQFSLGVAHEVGGQLAVAHAAVDSLPLLSKDDDKDAYAATLADLDTALRRIDAILAEMHDVGATHQRGVIAHTGSEVETAAATTVVSEVAARIQRLGRLHRKVRHTTLDCAGPDDLRARIAAERLEQVLLSLVINAADAVGGNGAIALTWRAENETCVICVDDDGPGIKEADAARIFEPFFTSKQAGDGSGLGLTVSRRLVEAAGGTLRALASGAAGGACMEVRLPLVD